MVEPRIRSRLTSVFVRILATVHYSVEFVVGQKGRGRNPDWARNWVAIRRLVTECPGWGSNPHGPRGPGDFKSDAATRAPGP